MSGHHYYPGLRRYCDSRHDPGCWSLRVCAATGSRFPPWSGRNGALPCSGRNQPPKLLDPDAALKRSKRAIWPKPLPATAPTASAWNSPLRFNLRKSNTEPVLRLNVETRQDPALLKAKTANSWA